MYCRYCGKELPTDSNFCPNCGKKQKEIKTSIPCGVKKFVEISKTYKQLAYFYSVWFVLHLCLFLFAKPKGIIGSHSVFPHQEYDYSVNFYPFSRSLGEIFEGRDFYVNILDVDNYDFSELFFYIVFFPIAVFGMVKCILIISSLLKNTKERYRNKTKKREECQGNVSAYITPQKEASYQKPISANVVAENVVSHVQEDTEEAIDKSLLSNEIDAGLDGQQQEEHIQEELACNEAKTKRKKMPLLSRFIGGIIDKLLILIIFVVGFTIISPYASTAKIGKYIGLFYAKLEVYEYIDKAEMNNNGTPNEEIAEYFQHGVRAEMEPPHIGSTLELDKSITFSFIILNIVFYIVFESILSASPGKWMLRGIILDNADDKIGFEKVLTRGLSGGALMVGTYFLLHLVYGLTNIVVVIVFFLLLDLPLLFTKKSLLDLCTGTAYAKR